MRFPHVDMRFLTWENLMSTWDFFPNMMLGKKSHVDMRFPRSKMGFFSQHDVGKKIPCQHGAPFPDGRGTIPHGEDTQNVFSKMTLRQKSTAGAHISFNFAPEVSVHFALVCPIETSQKALAKCIQHSAVGASKHKIVNV